MNISESESFLQQLADMITNLIILYDDLSPQIFSLSFILDLICRQVLRVNISGHVFSLEDLEKVVQVEFLFVSFIEKS